MAAGTSREGADAILGEAGQRADQRANADAAATPFGSRRPFAISAARGPRAPETASSSSDTGGSTAPFPPPSPSPSPIEADSAPSANTAARSPSPNADNGRRSGSQDRQARLRQRVQPRQTGLDVLGVAGGQLAHRTDHDLAAEQLAGTTNDEPTQYLERQVVDVDVVGELALYTAEQLLDGDASHATLREPALRNGNSSCRFALSAADTDPPGGRSRLAAASIATSGLANAAIASAISGAPAPLDANGTDRHPRRPARTSTPSIRARRNDRSGRPRSAPRSRPPSGQRPSSSIVSDTRSSHRTR